MIEIVNLKNCMQNVLRKLKIRLKNINVFVLAFLIFISIAYVMIFSYSTSPVYPFYYGRDSAQFLTIGKAWYLGKTPYIEMFDHKGPLIFWIDMIGFVLGNGQKYGVSLIQIVFMFFLVLSFFKISQLLYENKVYGCMVVIITLFLMKLNYCDGNSVEEYCLPFISWSLFGIIRFWKCKDMQNHNPKWAFVYGLTLGVCLLTRITNFLPLCTGIIFIILLLLYKKQYINLIQNILSGLLGFSVIVLPFLIYFLQKNALYECIYGTLIYNFEYAEARKSWILSANSEELMQYFKDYFVALIIFVAAFVSFLKKEYSFTLLLFLTGITEQFMYLSGDAFPQYPLVCIAQIPLTINLVMSLTYKNKPVEMMTVICSLFTIMSLLGTNLESMTNVITMRRDFKQRYDRGWEQLISMIPSDERKSFVVYGGNEFKELYLLDDLMPCYKYFIIQEWQGNISPETKTEIHDVFSSNEAKWILTDSDVNNIQDILTENYQLAGDVNQYFLYVIKD